MPKPKPRATTKPPTHPIAQSVRSALQDALRRDDVDVSAVRAGRDAAVALQETVPHAGMLAELPPPLEVYIHVVNQVSVLSEILTGLPALDRFVAIIGHAEEQYMPSWPPMSPISTSQFNT